jgi:hypothetical protein
MWILTYVPGSVFSAISTDVNTWRSNLSWLQYWPSNWHWLQYWTSMLRYLVVMYLCAIDIYFASFYDFFAPRNEVVREYTGFTMSVMWILTNVPGSVFSAISTDVNTWRSNLSWLQYWPSNWHWLQYWTSNLRRSLLSTFSMLRYLVVMYLCAIDIDFASFYDFFAPRNEVVREYTGSDPPLSTGKLLIKFQNILRNTTQVIIRLRVKLWK